MKHRVYGVDEESGEPIEIAIIAQDEIEAEEKAMRRGVVVHRVEPVRKAPRAEEGEVGFVDDAADEPSPLDHEDSVWIGGPSQWENCVAFLLCLLVIPIPWAVWRVLKTRCISYEVTSQRLRMRWGVFNRSLEEIEIYRVKDTSETQTVWQRLVGVGSVHVLSSDKSLPELWLRNLKEHSLVRDLVRKQTEAMRRARKVRELDVDS